MSCHCNAQHYRSARDWNPAETLFAFAGELTTMFPDQVVGATSNAAPMADRVTAFIKRHRLDSTRPGWENYIVPNKEGTWRRSSSGTGLTARVRGGKITSYQTKDG